MSLPFDIKKSSTIYYKSRITQKGTTTTVESGVSLVPVDVTDVSSITNGVISAKSSSITIPTGDADDRLYVLTDGLPSVTVNAGGTAYKRTGENIISFNYTGDTWVPNTYIDDRTFSVQQCGTLLASDAGDSIAARRFGTTVAFNEECTTLIVGAPADASGATGNSGSLYVYTLTGSTGSEYWNFTQKITEPAVANQYNGTNIAISDDAEVIVSSTNNNTQKVYVYRHNGTSYELEETLAGNSSLSQVGLSSDGNHIVVNDTFDFNAIYYQYSSTVGDWTTIAPQTIDVFTDSGEFGTTMCVIDFENNWLILSPNNDVVFYKWNGSSWVYNSKKSGGTGFVQGMAYLDGSSYILVCYRDGVYKSTRSGDTWSALTKVLTLPASSLSFTTSGSNNISVTQDNEWFTVIRPEQPVYTVRRLPLTSLKKASYSPDFWDEPLNYTHTTPVSAAYNSMAIKQGLGGIWIARGDGHANSTQTGDDALTGIVQLYRVIT